MLIKIQTNQKIITPHTKDTQKLIEKLDNETIYTGKQYLTLKTIEIKKITQYKIINGYLKLYINIESLAIKYFKDELITGKIVSQDENGLRVEICFFKVFIKFKYFLENCKFLRGKRELWSWFYKNNFYYFYNGDMIRFKVLNVDYENRILYGRIDEYGLGPCRWWI